MNTYPTNSALEAAIIAHPDEDTPRLAYADWLDENGDPDRAAFIRVQCQLAEMSPADPDWVGLIEEQDELAARLKPRHLWLALPEFDRFVYGSDLLDPHEEHFRRGFPYYFDCQTDGAEWTPDEVARVVADLTKLVRTTTIRGFHPYSLPVDALRELLAAPVLAELRGLSLMTYGGDLLRDLAEFFRLIGACPALRGVQQLFLYSPYHPIPAAPLAGAKTLDSVRRLTFQSVSGSKAELERLTRAAWFRRVRHFRCFLDASAVASTMITGLGKLPELHTLDLAAFAPRAVVALAAGKFPALARLMFCCTLATTTAKTLAKAKFPALRVFEGAYCSLKNDGLFALLKAKWFGQLRVLNLSDNAIGDKGVAALAAHPVAQTLRVLKLGDNAFGKSALTAIAKPGAFPALTTLSLRSFHVRKAKQADLAAFLSTFPISTVRHLDLMGWPLGNEGAKALAENPAFANLTRLDLDSCQIGDPGAKAIFASPYLQNLVELHIEDNAIKTGADALTDRKAFPRLSELWIGGNRIPKKTAEKFDRDDLYLIS